MNEVSICPASNLLYSGQATTNLLYFVNVTLIVRTWFVYSYPGISTYYHDSIAVTFVCSSGISLVVGLVTNLP